MARQYSFRTRPALYQEYLEFRETKAPPEQAVLDAAFEELLNLFCDDITVVTNDLGQPLLPPAHAVEMQILIPPVRFAIAVDHGNEHVWLYGISYSHP